MVTEKVHTRHVNLNEAIRLQLKKKHDVYTVRISILLITDWAVRWWFAKLSSGGEI